MRYSPRTAALAAVLLAVLLGIAAASCGGGGGGGSGAPAVRVIDAVAGAGVNYDVLVNSNAAVSNLATAQASALFAVSAGTASVQFEPAGSTTVILTATVTTVNGYNYSVMALQGRSGLAALAIAQSNAAVTAGRIRLAFVHAAAALAAFDIYVTAPAAALPPAPSLAALSYAGDGAAPAPAVLDQVAGDYRVRAVAAGDSARTVVFDSGPLTFASGADLLLAVYPVTGSAAPFSLLVTTAASGVYQVADQRVLTRVANFAPALGPADVYLDPGAAANTATNLIAGAIGPDAANAYLPQVPGAYRASFTATGQTAELVGGAQVLAAGTSVSLFAVGLAGQAAPGQLQILNLSDDLRAAAAGTARVRAAALAPDLAAVDLVELDATVTPPLIVRRLATTLAYPGTTAYLSLAAGVHTVALVPAGLDLPLLPAAGPAALSVADGSVYTLVIAGCRYPGSAVCAAAASPLHLVLLTDH